ncbi:alpha/beta fold hydrolase [Paraburkholderia xenovorans]|uniref:alpha/beta fold hydrolase n=1 Tax=Paraburkholderia xenovorans TaxID=36873 RepID=UPI0038BCE353
MPILRDGNDEIEYLVDGTGPALILVHGTGGNAETNWNGVAAQLAASRTVIRPNYSGSGRTTDDGAPLAVERLGEQVIAVANALGVETFDLAGYSLGAAVATYVAAKFSARVRRLVLIAGFATSDDARLRLQFELWRQLIDQNRRAAADLILLTGFGPAWMRERTHAELVDAADAIVEGNCWDGMRRQVELDLRIDVTGYAQKVVCPTLLIGCEHDHMVPLSHTRELEQMINGARCTVLPSGHLVPLEAPDLLAEQITAFLVAN